MSRWAPIIRRKICRTCASLCCSDKDIHVVLDREEVERRLHQYRDMSGRLSVCFSSTILC